MGQNPQNCEDGEINLSNHIKIIAKRKKTLIVVFLATLIIAIGGDKMQVSPKLYRSLMMVQPPVVGPSLTGANDLESPENLKGLIVNGAFNEELLKKSGLDFDRDSLVFKVVIPDKTNILQVSIDLESKNKELGPVLLRNLSEVIAGSYAKSIEAKINDIDSQIKSNERSIAKAKERAGNLQAQITEITAREDKLRGEINAIYLNTARILEKREELFKENPAADYSNTYFLLLNSVQNNSSYLNLVNNQFSDLSFRRVNLSLELENIDTQSNNFQMEIEKLNTNKGFITNLKILARPKVSLKPIVPKKKKTLAISIIMGLSLGVLAVFLQEFWVNNLNKK